MGRKRAGSEPGAVAAAVVSGPVWIGVLMGAAVSYGIALLVSRGRMSWPPSQLLASLYTVAGCLALVGPIVLARGEAGEGGLGGLLWMTAGPLGSGCDLAALLRRDRDATARAT